MKALFKRHALIVLSTAAIVGSIVFVHKGMAVGDISPFHGTKSAGMAGVGAAIPLDATSGSTNPALMANKNVIICHYNKEPSSFSYRSLTSSLDMVLIELVRDSRSISSPSRRSAVLSLFMTVPMSESYAISTYVSMKLSGIESIYGPISSL